jgi:(R)-2-hydroxyacyl-CoA dehydratese activating ATPase
MHLSRQSRRRRGDDGTGQGSDPLLSGKGWGMTRYFAGIDIGSTITKVVIVGGGDRIAASVIGPTGAEHRKLANKVMEDALRQADLCFDRISFVVATGYGRINVPFADKQVTEISCHARGVHSLFPTVRTIIDVGGQDSKGIKLVSGKIKEFVMNDKCAAGTGRFLEVIADALDVPLAELGRISLSANKAIPISNTCTVFAEQEIVSQLAQGESKVNLIAGVHEAIAARVCSMANKLKIEPGVVMTGGGAKNIGLVKAMEARCGYMVAVPPEPLITGALGAALIGKEALEIAQQADQPVMRQKGGLAEARFFT